MLEERRRTRVVFYRITEDEYATLQDLCSSVGARTVSELTRIAVHELIGSGQQRPGLGLAQQLRTLTDTLNEMNRSINQLAKDIKRDDGPEERERRR
jgi:hypothetical protein